MSGAVRVHNLIIRRQFLTGTTNFSGKTVQPQTRPLCTRASSRSRKLDTLADTTTHVPLDQHTTKMFNPSEIVATATAQAEELVLDQLKKSDDVANLMEQLLNMSQVRIGDASAVNAKLRQMAFGGPRKLLIISDFDYTLSRFANEEGERLSTTHGVFDDNVMRLKPELGQKFIDLKNKYYPIEFDPLMTVEEKIPHMEKWWGTSHGLIINERFSKSTIEDFVRQSRVVFKDGAEDLINSLDARRIPLVIFSAGIGNIIEIFLRQKLGAVPENTHFISNMILFDENETSCDFTTPLIHTYCKNSSVIQKEASFFHHIAGRTNVILLGDSMGDIHMDVGVEKDGPTLRVGYYNGDLKDEDSLNHYTEVYDIVLIHDPTTFVPQKIVDMVNGRHF